MQVQTIYQCVKFHVNIPTGCSENGKQFRGYFILVHPVHALGNVLVLHLHKKVSFSSNLT